MQRQGSHGALVPDVEYDLIVGRHRVMVPLYLSRRTFHVAVFQHQSLAARPQLEIVLVEEVTAGVGKEQRTLVATVDVTEIGRVGIDAGLLKWRMLSCARELRRKQQQQGQQHPDHTFRQTEEEAAAFTQRALGLQGTDREDLAQLTVFLDDALTVEQAKAMRFLYGWASCRLRAISSNGLGMVGRLIFQTFHTEQAGQLLFTHADTGISDRHLDTIIKLLGTDGDPSALGRELARIVGQGIQHEKGEDAVGLDCDISGQDVERHALHREPHLAMLHNGEEGLQRKAFYAQAQLTLAQLNPVGKHAVIFVDLVGQLQHVLLLPLLVSGIAIVVGCRR